MQRCSSSLASPLVMVLVVTAQACTMESDPEGVLTGPPMPQAGAPNGDPSAMPPGNGPTNVPSPPAQGGPNAGQQPGDGQPAPGQPTPDNGGDPTMDAGGQANNGWDAGAPGPDAQVVDGVRPPCMKDPRQVILMGDSYINWVSHTFPQDMAKNFGNGAEGVWDVPYGEGGRLYAIGAWAMGSGGIGLIPDQLDFALADDPDIIAVIMTGGGNDLLVPGAEWPGGADCKNSTANPPLQVCQDIAQKAFDAARMLMQRSADAGIRDVVYFFYPEVPAPTLIGGTSPNTVLNWTYPMVQELCDDTEAMTDGQLRCHFIDTRPIFDGHPDWFAPTDIHPSPAGSDALTKEIAKLMRERCLAQPESSGCCEP